jgi:hypothetical protein
MGVPKPLSDAELRSLALNEERIDFKTAAYHRLEVADEASPVGSISFRYCQDGSIFFTDLRVTRRFQGRGLGGFLVKKAREMIASYYPLATIVRGEVVSRTSLHLLTKVFGTPVSLAYKGTAISADEIHLHLPDALEQGDEDDEDAWYSDVTVTSEFRLA